MSAFFISSSILLASSGNPAIPALNEIFSFVIFPKFARLYCNNFSFNLSARLYAIFLPVSGITITNSSPPYLAIKSGFLIESLNRTAIFF